MPIAFVPMVAITANKKGKTMRETIMLFIVMDDTYQVYAMYDNLQDAENVIAKVGNEFWSIDVEEVC